MTNEIWKKIDSTKRTTRYISNLGRCMTKWNGTGKTHITFGAINKALGYRTFAGDYVHRHVARAFLGKLGNKQVDHVTGNREDNRASALRIVSRADNNSTEISRLLRSMHHNCNRHNGEMIEATKGGITYYFNTGTEAAKKIGCSHVLIYNVINGKLSARKARGWSLRWVKSANV